jgi:hypothetical protein
LEEFSNLPFWPIGQSRRIAGQSQQELGEPMLGALDCRPMPVDGDGRGKLFGALGRLQG